jgi:hypothetical protein
VLKHVYVKTNGIIRYNVTFSIILSYLNFYFVPYLNSVVLIVLCLVVVCSCEYGIMSYVFDLSSERERKRQEL